MNLAILPISLCALLLVVSTPVGGAHQDATQWTEHCHTSSKRYYLSPNQIFKGLYANPSYKGQLLANVWVKIVPRTDTKEGQLEYENEVKQLKKKVKGKYTDYSYQLGKMQFSCSSRTYHIASSTDYDSKGEVVYEWPVSLADVLHEEDVTPGSISECIMKVACDQLSKEPNK